MTTLDNAVGAGNGLFDSLKSKGEALLARLADRWNRYQTYTQLSRLDDRLLADMGLTRTDVESWYRG